MIYLVCCKTDLALGLRRLSVVCSSYVDGIVCGIAVSIRLFICKPADEGRAIISFARSVFGWGGGRRAWRRSRDNEKPRGHSSGYCQHMWNYEKIAQNEAMAEAFRAFANRALCQESLWFLEEVARYIYIYIYLLGDEA